MSGIRIKNQGIYRIEVNDNGDYIEIDVDDIGTPVKCYESIDKIKKIQEETEIKMKELLDSNDTEKNKKRKMTFIEDEMFKKIRKSIDNFLGENASQKIFGDKNFYGMYDALFKELSKKRPELNGKSHFDVMGIKAKSINEKIINKYQKNIKKVI